MFVCICVYSINSLCQRIPNNTPTHEDQRWLIPENQLTLGVELGRGAFGVVFRGEWHGLPVAVKRFDSENLNSPYYVGLWLQELRINATLRHPNIVQYLGACLRQNSFPLVVMELLPASLRDVIAASSLPGAALTLREQLDLLCDLARGIAHIHDHRVTHGDISSSNAMVNEQMLAKVADLGEAHIMNRTRTVLNPVNPVYCDPRRMPGTAVDAYKSDCYSFGVVMIEVCLGAAPDVAQRALQLQQVATASLRTLAGSCIDLDPARRPTMLQILDALRAVQNTDPNYRACPPRRSVAKDNNGIVVLA